MDRRPITRWWLVVSLVASVGVMWAPWVRSGETSRNSFEAFRSAQRLGLDHLDPWRVWWFVLPFVAGAALVALLAARSRTAGALAVLVGLTMAGAGIYVLTQAIAEAVGSWMAIVIGLSTVCAGGVLLVPPSEEPAQPSAQGR